MNDALPPWRTFGSPEPEDPPDEGPAPPRVGRPPARWGLIALVAGAGVAAVSAAVLLVLALVVVGADSPSVATLGEPLGWDGTPAEPTTELALVVDVAGAVQRPGLHRLRAGARVGDAIEMAGGYGPRVDLDAASRQLNLARPLDDGAKILVPELGLTHVSEAAGDGRIDLNRASQAQLEELPGVGPVTARRIIDARASQRFGSVRDLRTRGLLSERVFEDVRQLVSAG